MARFPPMTLPEVFFRNASSGSLAHRVTFFWDKRESSISLISASMVKIHVFRAFDWLFKPFSEAMVPLGLSLSAVFFSWSDLISTL